MTAPVLCLLPEGQKFQGSLFLVFLMVMKIYQQIQKKSLTHQTVPFNLEEHSGSYLCLEKTQLFPLKKNTSWPCGPSAQLPDVIDDHSSLQVELRQVFPMCRRVIGAAIFL